MLGWQEPMGCCVPLLAQTAGVAAIKTSAMVALVTSARVWLFIPSVPQIPPRGRSQPPWLHWDIQAGSELLQLSSWAQVSSVAEKFCRYNSTLRMFL